MNYAAFQSLPAVRGFVPGRGRRGASAIEIMVCLLAVVVGLWAGASYLGINLHAAWEIGMEKAGFATPQLRQAKPGVPPGLPHAADTATNPPASADAAQPASSAADDQPPGESAVGSVEDGSAIQADAGSTNNSSVGERTFTYWSELRKIVLSERHQDEARVSTTVRDVLSTRGKSFRDAVQAIRGLASDGVDPEVLHLAQDFARWYERGAELNEEGAYLLDEGELTDAQGPIGRRWHSAQKQHREELDLLNRKSNSQRSKLSARYSLAFPGLL